MVGNVTTLEGLQMTGKYRNRSMQHTCSRHADWHPDTLCFVSLVLTSSFLPGAPLLLKRKGRPLGHLQGFLAHYPYPRNPLGP
jgi:hypothetical protein